MSGRLLCFVLLALSAVAQEPPIFEAARTGDIDKLTPLLSDKVQLMAKGREGRTALHEAADACHVDAARLIADAGADLIALDSQNNTAGMLALRCADPTTRAFLFRYLRPPPPRQATEPWALQYAIARGQSSIVSMLLTLNVDVNGIDPNGDRPLDVACLKGDPGIVRLLLSRGADPRLRNKIGATPLHDAALKGSEEIIELLIGRGADPNTPDAETGATPLHYAASFGRLGAARVLIAKGATVEARDNNGITPLAAARKNGHQDLSKLLTAPR